MPDVFTKAKRSEVMSRIRAALWQPFGRSGEIAPDESGSQCVGAVGLIENPTLRRVHVVHGLFQHAGGVQPIPHAPLFGSIASKIKVNVSEAQQAAPESLNPVKGRGPHGALRPQPSTFNRFNG